MFEFASPHFTPEDLQYLQSGPSLLLVSGGPDSVYLFHLFLQLREQGIKFAVLHVNHHLRGAESDGDEKFVSELCKQHQITCHVSHAHFASKSGIQNAARRFRARVCRELMATHHYICCVTAHHRDDQIETLILHASRGAGLSGLSGMRRWSQGHVFRPLLGISKTAILAELAAHKIAFRQDSSNATRNYKRNRVRQFLAEQTVATTQLAQQADALQPFAAYFDERLQNVLSVYGSCVPRMVWDGWPDELRFRYFAVQMRRFGYRQQVERRHGEKLRATEAVLSLGDACFAIDAAGVVFGSAKELKRSTSPNPSLCPEGNPLGGQRRGTSLPLCKGALEGVEQYAAPSSYKITKPGAYYFGSLDLRCQLRLLSADEPRPSDPLTHYLAADALPWPLTISLTDPHAEFTPFGRTKPTRVGDYLQERHIPRHHRSLIPVLKTTDEQIVLVFYADLSNDYRIVPSTRSVLAISIF